MPSLLGIPAVVLCGRLNKLVRVAVQMYVLGQAKGVTQWV
jgi:hypothetical protein